MKRRLLIAIVFLLAGAVVNVAVAWGCAVLSPVQGGVITAFLDGMQPDDIYIYPAFKGRGVDIDFVQLV